MSDRRRQRQRGWLIERRVQDQSEYFAGTLYGEAQSFVRHSALAIQYLTRAAAARELRLYIGLRPRDVRIVPVWL